MQLDPQKHATPLAFFLATNRKEVKWFASVTLCYCLAVICMTFATYQVGRLIDLLSPVPHGDIRLAVTIIFVSLIGREIFYRTGHAIEVGAEARARASTKRAFFDHITTLGFSYFSDRFSGQTAHKVIATTDAIDRMVAIIDNEFVNDGAILVVSAIALSLTSPALGLLVFIWSAVFLVGIIPYAKYLNTRSSEYADKETETSGIVVDVFTNMASVKVYGNATSHERAYAQIEAERRALTRLGFWSVLAYNYIGMMVIGLCVALIVAIHYMYGHGLITIGTIAFVAGITLSIFSLAWDLGLSLIQFIRERGEATQNLKDLIVAPAVKDRAATAAPVHETVAVAYDNVTFAYGDKSPVLKHFSLTVPAGQKVGIVGLSGAGKTTFANLLLRFFDVQSGSVRINDADVRELPQAYLRSHISYISQDTSLFHMTIAENIAYGMSGADDDAIAQAAKLAYADEFIATLPEKYQSVVGERGIKLSGGQRQRIAIARAILANRPLFLLDEATSALDSDSEAKIQKGLEVLMEGKTVIAIAHRLSTLSRMDRIIYLEGGKILEDGSHDELLAKNGRYAQLWHMQAGGFLPA